MFHQLLVPLDGSELAERALPSAERLARAEGATLHLVRVIDLMPDGAWAPLSTYVPTDFYESELQQATTYLETLRDRLTAADLRIQITTLTGDVGATLLDYERDARIDLVVMCSHGRSGLARFALGSVAERLLHYGAVPLLLVRAFGAPANLAEAVVPLDGSRLAEQALPMVEQVAPMVTHEVTVLRAIDDEEQLLDAERYLKEIAGRLQARNITCKPLVVQGDPAQVILDQAGAERLVIMATHGRSGLTRWALGSVADRVARGGAAAVLAVRAGKE